MANELVDEQLLDDAVRKLNRLRLTKAAKGQRCITVDQVLRRGLGPLFKDEAIRYILRAGVRYYLRAQAGRQDAPR